MNPQKIISIILFFISFGAINETARILTSNAADISPNRTLLIIISVSITLAILYFAVKLWIKGSKIK